MRIARLLVVPLKIVAVSALSAQDPTPTRERIGERLEAGVDRIDASTGVEEIALRGMRDLASQCAELLPKGSRLADRLRGLAVTRQEGGTAAGQLTDLRRQLRQAAGDLRFEPVREAPVPDGWPTFTAVDEIEIKSYPAYRMARAPMRGSGDMSAFWSLFQHIQINSIPMTAPVQIDYAKAAESEPEAESMAFLYEDRERGQTGSRGKVEVVDSPAVTVVSIGVRGRDTENRIDEARTALEDWLEEHADEYRPADRMRVMGWNSPSVRGDRRYFEVQIPVRVVR